MWKKNKIIEKRTDSKEAMNIIIKKNKMKKNKNKFKKKQEKQ